METCSEYLLELLSPWKCVKGTHWNGLTDATTMSTHNIGCHDYLDTFLSNTRPAEPRYTLPLQTV